MIDSRALSLLAEKYPNIWAVSAELINLRAVSALPKGTEYFLSDLHGEHEAFVHMIKSASGIIRYKIGDYFKDILTEKEMDELAVLIYDAENEIRRRKASEKDFDKWCSEAIYHLIDVCWLVSNKYTRDKVRRRLPTYLGHAMDELLHSEDEENKAQYYDSIISSVIECGVAETFITDLTEVIYRLAVDQLHIIGDIFDRGAHPDRIMDYLLGLEDVDFQWGNHDVLWMGAACGNIACIANVLRNNIGYNNFDMLEIGYGINLRPLTSLAASVYWDDPCTEFKPHVYDENRFDPVSMRMASKMNKAISVILLKVEGQCIMRHPEYKMESRLLLDKIDWEKGTVTIGGAEWPLKDTHFPTIDPEHPYELSKDELFVVNALEASFRQSEKLQSHVRLLFEHGALFKIVNGNLLYHGCIPMTDDGEFIDVKLAGEAHHGRALFEYLDDQVRKHYYAPEAAVEGGEPGDLMWYLWNGSRSPLFGKNRMATFERLFIADTSTHTETKGAYYSLINEREPVEKIIREFGLDPSTSRIINGHVPVKLKDGESPRKADGLLYIIDGGMSKAYQKKTGIAGYTFIYNSHMMALVEHKPYSPLQPDGTQVFRAPVMHVVEKVEKRQLVADTDTGRELTEQIEDLKALLEAYRNGSIKERQ